MIQYDCEIQDMGPEEIKEANRLMWLVKGQLCPIEYSKKDIHGVFRGYFKRLWCNNERSEYAEDGFEEAWNQRQWHLAEKEQEEIDTICIRSMD